jgi:hypothetical protein
MEEMVVESTTDSPIWTGKTGPQAGNRHIDLKWRIAMHNHIQMPARSPAAVTG